MMGLNQLFGDAETQTRPAKLPCGCHVTLQQSQHIEDELCPDFSASTCMLDFANLQQCSQTVQHNVYSHHSL